MAQSPPRRRIVGIAALGLAGALAAGAIAIPTFVEPRVLKVPLTAGSVSEATGFATMVDVATLVRDRTLATHRVPVRATQMISVIEPSDDTIMTIQTAHRMSRADIDSPTDSTITAAVTQITVDRRTGYPVPGRDAKIFSKHDAPATTHTIDGLSFKFPFGTKTHTYRFFDHTAHNSYSMEFQGVDTVEGIEVYRFRSETPQVRIGEPLSLPAEYFGGSKGDTREVSRYYHATREFRVEPLTGMIVDARQTARQYVAAAPDSETRVTLIDVDAGWSEATRTAQFDDARRARAMIQWGLHRSPWLGWLLAATMLGIGVAALRNRSGSAPEGPVRR
ncbi:DUF3068 domain-containing protein [Nocardia sp. SSK8]|uniref:DUF3068 domain-containing protein n=1 Tax=Nocardia sp. SSK8 TaxID=3120154 RepID=UPI003008AD4A